MITVRRVAELKSVHGARALAVAFGVFDGVHVGHRRVLQAVCAHARRQETIPTVITFDPHPRAVLSDREPPPLLTPLPQKLRLLEAEGIRAAVLLPFDRAMASLPPEHFLEQHVFVPEGPRIDAICVGASWRFGRGGAGSVASLLAHAAQPRNCTVVSVPELLDDGRPVSSTRIREHVQCAQLDVARRLLGRDFSVRGTVVAGKGMGRSLLGCPTANLDAAHMLLPPDGVYAARGTLENRAPECQGIVYVGRAPTLIRDPNTDVPRTVELHLFDITADLYGQDIEVAFVACIRPDRRFAGPDELRRQIQQDIARAKVLLAASTPTPSGRNGPSPRACR
ncbi:MAG: riboflavin biosynthesis protein RibF [Lentisphaeria bacterium]|nr:riboflavin biosynthesis protein RibF [Lentisphaeria bacterium]